MSDISVGDISIIATEARVVLGEPALYIAAQISSTPAGGVSASNVQAAINELDADKEVAGAAAAAVAAHVSGAHTAAAILTLLTADSTLAAGSLLIGQGTSQLLSTGSALTYSGGVFQIAGSVPGTPSAGQALLGGGAGKFGGPLSCTALTFAINYTLSAGLNANSAKLKSSGGSNYWQMHDYADTSLGFIGFSAVDDCRIFAGSGPQLARFSTTGSAFTGGSTPGTPAATEVLIGNGAIKAGAGISGTTLGSTTGYIHSHKAVSDSFLSGPIVSVENVAGDKVGAMQLGTNTLDFWVYESAALKALSINRSTMAAVFGAGVTCTTLTALSYFSCNGATAAAPATGYGTPTNGAVQGSFDATSITLVNLAKAVAKLIIDLKATGLVAV